MDPQPASPAPSDRQPPTPATFGFDWPNAILLAATVCLLAVVAGAIGQLASGHRDGTWMLLAMFMACFSVFKLMVALRAVREVRLVPKGGIDPREHFGSAGRFWIWVAVKVVVAIVAMSAAAIIVLHGPGALR